MNQTCTQDETLGTRIASVVRHYWGFEQLRPLQEQAIVAGTLQRDSLVVMPTGGGKSLCYQAAAALADRTDVVVSPLIALMKDQVDGLRGCGYPAVALNSNLSTDELRAAESEIVSGTCRLVYVAPERLLTPRMQNLLKNVKVRSFAIDEAHCISHWGHDFRPEYRRLSVLKERFSGASVHAFTATATERVRQDIVQQLGLKDPTVLVGDFDRTNLIYRVVPRTHARQQARDILERHRGQAAIVYCLSRREAEDMADFLRQTGIRAAFYHAGMDAKSRRQTQDDFSSEKLDVVAATVAFGMGIDRSDVRCVIHATMPKSIEHYQQETGRAGRDGLEAECVLLYSAADVFRWERLIEKSAQEGAEKPEEVVGAAQSLLKHMQHFASGIRCRHRTLVEYFGQVYTQNECGACDVCLKEFEVDEESIIIAQKILSCVAHVKCNFGASYVADVLLGVDTAQIRRWGHDQLTTYGLMKESDRKTIVNQIHQLVDQQALVRTSGDRPIVKLNEASWRIMRKEMPVTLLKPKIKTVKKSKTESQAWEGVDSGLFESLRLLRREIARERGVPAFIVFGDRTLRELARVRPGSIHAFKNIHGVGRKKSEDLGLQFVKHIAEYCRSHALDVDAEPTSYHRRRNSKKTL